MTAESVFSKVRSLLGDKFAPYRWETAELRVHLASALRRLNSLVPATRKAARYTCSDACELARARAYQRAADAKLRTRVGCHWLV